MKVWILPIMILLLAGAVSAVDEGLVHHWTYDEGEGIVTEDLASGDNATLTHVGDNAAWIPDGAIDGAYHFDAGDWYNGSYFQASDSSLVDTANLSLTFWFRSDCWAGASSNLICSNFNIVTKDWDGSNRGFGAYISYAGQTPPNNGSVALLVGKGGGWDITSAISPGVIDTGWHHIAMVRQTGPQITLIYIDGVNVVNGTWTSNLLNNAPIRMGKAYNNLIDAGAGRGDLDDVRFYNRSITYDDIVEIMAYEAPEEVVVVSESSSGNTRYIVDEEGNLVGVQQGQQVTLLEEADDEAPFLSIGGGEKFDFKAWVEKVVALVAGLFS